GRSRGPRVLFLDAEIFIDPRPGPRPRPRPRGGAWSPPLLPEPASPGRPTPGHLDGADRPPNRHGAAGHVGDLRKMSSQVSKTNVGPTGNKTSSRSPAAGPQLTGNARSSVRRRRGPRAATDLR